VAFTRDGSQKQPPLLQSLAAALRRRLDAEYEVWGRQIEGWPSGASPYR
jgi:hypothetical protein